MLLRILLFLAGRIQLCSENTYVFTHFVFECGHIRILERCYST